MPDANGRRIATGVWVPYIYPQNQSKQTFYGVEMPSERLLDMSIEVLYLPKKFYRPTPKQISGYAPGQRANHYTKPPPNWSPIPVTWQAL